MQLHKILEAKTKSETFKNEKIRKLTYSSTFLRCLSSISGVSGTVGRGCLWRGGGGGWLHAIVESFARGVLEVKYVFASYL